MDISTSSLKSLVKKLGSVRAEVVTFGKSRFIASDSDVTLVIANDFPDDLFGFAVNLRKFSSVVNRLSGDVSLSLTGGGLSLTSAKTKIVLETQEAKRPLFKVAGKTIALPLNTVKSLLQYAATCAEPDRVHPLGGVVHLGTKVAGIEVETVVALTAAGASASRLAVVEEAAETQPFKTLIPLSALAPIQAMTGEVLNFSEGETQLYFEADGVEVYVAKLAKERPDLTAAVPKEFAFVFEVSAEDFKSSLRAVEPIIDARDKRGCGVKVHFLDNEVVIKSLGLVGGSAEDSFSCTQITPDPIFDAAEFKVAINHRFLSDFFGSASGTVRLSGNSSLQPVLLESGNKKALLAVMKED